MDKILSKLAYCVLFNLVYVYEVVNIALKNSGNTLLWTNAVNFSGIIKEKLPNAEFVVRLTHFPDGSKISEDNEVLINGKSTGRIKGRKIKIAIHDSVTVSISMESAQSKSGFITYREKAKAKTKP
jgi:translation initiation factor IF-1